MQTIRDYDASFCGKLPLHQINSIQPHGVILLVDKAIENILQVSENIAALLSQPAAAVLRSPIASIFSQTSIQQLREAIDQGIDEKIPMHIHFMVEDVTTGVFCFIHEVEEGYIIEAALKEFYPAQPETFIDIYQRVKHVMQQVNNAKTIEAVSSITAKYLKQLNGFDKVMVYRFDEQWNGLVIAEEAEEGMETYLGLMFPASDIPKPARDMYQKNPYRIIPDRNYEPVKLYPLINPVSGGFTNLMKADLRSVASVHLEYLQNMNVVASMSARLLYGDKLWGLIACHHRTAKYLSFEECSVIEMISNIVSQKISSIINNEKANRREHLSQLFVSLADKMVDKQTMLDAFADNAAALKDYLQADGIALCWEGNIETEGNTPEIADIVTLVFWLREKAKHQIFHEPQLPAVFEESKAFADKCSGILALPIQPDKGNYLIAFRQEVIKTVSWSGNPNEAVQFENNSTLYHPRHSFSVWQQTVHHTARKWHEEEIASAEHLRNFLVQQTLNRLN